MPGPKRRGVAPAACLVLTLGSAPVLHAQSSPTEASPATTQEAPAAAEGSLAREMTMLRAEVRNQQEMVGLLRQRLRESESTNSLVPLLALALLVSIGLMLMLWWRARQPGQADDELPSRHRSRGRRRSRESTDADDPAGPATVFMAPQPGVLQQSSSTAAAQIDTRRMAGEAADAAARGQAEATQPAASPLQALVRAPAPNPASAAAGLAPAFGLAPAVAPSAVGGSSPGGSLPPAVPSVQGVGEAHAARSDSGLGSGLGGLTVPPAAGGGLGRMPVVAEPPVRATEMTMATGQTPRALSVEELLDLEQQVDFFLVLGQTESAVDLLVGHIRSTGGNSALPYIKLMEVYRQQGDADSYERTRRRFNQRFNAHAPAWTDDTRAARSLEDYPEVVIRLQRVWHSPLDALADLESLLYRRHRGELFDLPAFRDVLLLHGMAVDLHEHSPMSTTRVDILLPLGEDQPGNTVPEPHLTAPPAARLADMPRLATLAQMAAATELGAPAPSAKSLLAEWSSLDDGTGQPGPAALLPTRGPLVDLELGPESSARGPATPMPLARMPGLESLSGLPDLPPLPPLPASAQPQAAPAGLAPLEFDDYPPLSRPAR